MSFFSNNRSAEIGNVSGNPLNGLCEKVCIQVKKVFDACLSQMTMEAIKITVNQLNPQPVTPVTFISGRSVTTKGIISNLFVDRLEDRPNFARVRCDITVPVQVTYVDANGVEGTGSAQLGVHKDIILFVPEASIIPFSIESVVSAVIPEGIFDLQAGETLSFTCDVCLTVILKVVIEVELLVPSYGYAHIPPCQDFTQEVCTGFFDMPLFPSVTPRG
jgi:hypothetical protein